MEEAGAGVTGTGHPLDGTFARAARLSPYIRARVGRQGGGGWLTPDALFAGEPSLLDTLIHEQQQRLHTTSPNVVGSAIFQNYQWPIIGTAIASSLIDRRVPDLAVGNVQVELSQTNDALAMAVATGRFFCLPDDPMAAHPDATPLPDRGALRERLRLELEAHLGWVIDRICQDVGCRSRGLWLAAADRCTSTLAWLMQEQDAQVGLRCISAEVEPLIRLPGSPLANDKVGLVEISCGDRSEVFFQRATCCYWYKSDGGAYCSTCPALPRAERLERLRQHVASNH